MKVCHVATGYPISLQGGITNYVRTLAEYQTKIGYDVTVISGPCEEQYPFHLFIYKSKKIYPMRWRAPVDKKGLKELKAFFDEQQFDIIHIHMMLDIDWDLYEAVKPYHYVISLHDYFFLCPRIQMLTHDNTICSSYEKDKCAHCISLFNTIRLTNGIEYRISHKTPLKNFRLPEIPQRMTEKRFTKFKTLLEHAAYLLPVSTRVQEIFEQSGINGNYKMMHIGNITADHYSDQYSFDENKTGVDIAMLGTLTYIKGADLFIRIAEGVSDNVRIHFYGRSSKYTDQIARAGIIDHGPYKQNELGNILKNIDIGMCLSVWEDNGPQVVMEFINNHIPVIGTRLGGIPDFITDGVNGYLINPFDENDINRVINILNHMTREKIKELKSNTKRTTTTKEHCEAILELYESIVKLGRTTKLCNLI